MSNTLLLTYNLQFFAKEGPGGEKTEAPTSKKLSDARKEGKVAKSQELSAAFILIGLFLTLKIVCSYLATSFIDTFSWIFRIFPDVVSMSAGGLSIDTAGALLRESVKKILLITLPFLAMGVVISFVSGVLQAGWQITTKPLEPKLDKFNPINGFKKMFSKESLFNLLKSILKLALIFYVAYSSIKNNRNDLFILYDISLNQAIALVGSIIINTGLKISIIYLVIGFADYAYQKWKFKDDMKMTKQEIKDEYKDSEGDPQIKGQQKRRMQEASRRRMIQNVSSADVVITNPEHLAVALRYKPELGDNAPIVVAKGEDYWAGVIRERAKEANVPIKQNKAVARMLYTQIEVNQAITPDLFEAVALILAEVFRENGKDIFAN